MAKWKVPENWKKIYEQNMIQGYTDYASHPRKYQDASKQAKWTIRWAQEHIKKVPKDDILQYSATIRTIGYNRGLLKAKKKLKRVI